MLYLLFIIWPVTSILIFIYINKIWNKKNHVLLNVFYAVTWLFFYPFEMLYWYILRSKYNKKTTEVLEKLNASEFKYHIVFGTLLFAYRDNNFRDTDIDICVYRKDFNQKQKDILKTLGFALKEQWSLDGKIAEQAYENKDLKVQMDIFHISSDGPEFAPTFDEKNNRYARRPKAYKYSLSTLRVKGIEVKAPSNPEEYLTWNYGVWKKKDVNYHWFHGSSTNPTKVVENANIEYKKFK